MGLTNVSGVFSRYFIVGFFLPAFFVLVTLAQVVDIGSSVAVYEDAKPATRVLIVGGAALLGGLLLLGLHYPILRLYEGYPLAAAGNRRPWKWLYLPLLSRQKRRLAKAEDQTEVADEAKAFDARWRLDLSFPHDQPGLLLPTSFGNAVRAFERHSMSRWYVNSIGVWPHVEALLSDQEAQVLADARSDVAFFVNASLVSAIAVPVLAVDAITAHVTSGWLLDVLVCAIPAALGVLAYWASIGAAQRWGDVVRAAIDLHRREVYDKLGIRKPKNFADEREIAWRLNATLLVGDRLPDDLAAPVRTAGDEATAPTVGAAVTQLLDRMLTDATGAKDHD